MSVQGYGAYLTLMMLKSTDNIFKCACVMSPVTDWKLYGEYTDSAACWQKGFPHTDWKKSLRTTKM